MSNTACQPYGTDIFSAENIRNCEKYVRRIQSKLDKAVANNDQSKIRWYTHLLSFRSRSVKILAVHHVTSQNKGRYTAGIDGMKMKKGKKDRNEQTRLCLLNRINVKKSPSPIKRVLIPKPNGKKRPLGILTITDRIVQDILRMTLQPITEYHANENSYGFRPKRSCQDAVDHLYKKLRRRDCKQWLIEGDICSCFDNISHQHVLNTLSTWHIPRQIRGIIEKMLKAQIFSDNQLQPVQTGMPQGGILSPMLANVALTALDDYCRDAFGVKQAGRINNPIVRFADDFVIICKSKSDAIEIKHKIAIFLSENIGLCLSEEKTKITHVSKGFNFLGFNVKKYTHKSHKSKYHTVGKLLIKPQKQKVNHFLAEIQQVLNHNKTAKTDTILHLLNPMLQGFAMYYRFVVSKTTFSYINHHLWKKLFRWAVRRHPNKSKRWIYRKYFTTKGKRKWVFKSDSGDTVLCIDTIPIVRFVKIRASMRVHAGDNTTKVYWQKREYTNALSQVYSIKVEKLMKRQKGLCPSCECAITRDDITAKRVHTHHMLPRSEGGCEKPNNLRLLHLDCHKWAHGVLTRKEMADWMTKKLNYITHYNLRSFQTHQGVSG